MRPGPRQGLELVPAGAPPPCPPRWCTRRVNGARSMVSARPLAANSPAAGQLFRYLRRGRRFARAAPGPAPLAIAGKRSGRGYSSRTGPRAGVTCPALASSHVALRPKRNPPRPPTRQMFRTAVWPDTGPKPRTSPTRTSPPSSNARRPGAGLRTAGRGASVRRGGTGALRRCPGPDGVRGQPGHRYRRAADRRA